MNTKNISGVHHCLEYIRTTLENEDFYALGFFHKSDEDLLINSVN